MSRQFRLPLIVLVCAASSGCLHQAIPRPEDLTANHDHVETFTVPRPFDDVHAFISSTATKCYAKVFSGGAMPAGKGYVTTATIRREVDDRVLEPGKLASVAIVVRGGPWPMGPEDYILRADVKGLGPSETEVTTYNAGANRAQRAFHRQVHRWAAESVEDCSGMGPFGD